MSEILSNEDMKKMKKDLCETAEEAIKRLVFMQKQPKPIFYSVRHKGSNKYGGVDAVNDFITKNKGYDIS